ncbi:RCC1-like domain-containing protein [Microbacterium sp. oral taxon 186]
MGRNDHGQLGDGTQLDRHTPTRVLELDNVVGIACAGKTSFALVRVASA